MQRSACGSQAAQVSTISTSRKVSHGAKAMSLPMREKACESPTSARALQVPHAPASLAGLHVCERLQSPLARSKADKSSQFGKADSHSRAREPCKSPMRPRALQVCMYAKDCKVHLRGQRLTSLHNSERLIVSRVHNAHTRPRARKTWKSLNGSKALQVSMYRGKADESPPRPKPARSASRFGSRESLLFAPAPLKSLTNAEKFGSRLVERRASKSATAFYALFVRENTQF